MNGKKFLISWLLIIIILLFGFYWGELRPTDIRKKCMNSVYKGDYKIDGGGIEGMNFLLKTCFLENGINE
jgi:preprotein translocase subunit YajC